MAAENLEEFAAILAGEAPLQAYLERQLERIRAAKTMPELLEALGDIASPVDLEAYERELADHGLAVWQEVARTGLWGWFDDDVAAVGNWGFPLDRAGAHVAIWHGDEDSTVPPAHAKWLAGHLPGARLTLLPHVGHNSIVNHYGAILDDLTRGV